MFIPVFSLRNAAHFDTTLTRLFLHIFMTIWNTILSEKYIFSQFYCTSSIQVNIPATKHLTMLTRMNGFITKTILFVYIIKEKQSHLPLFCSPYTHLKWMCKMFVTSKCHFCLATIWHKIAIFSKTTTDTYFLVPNYENMECFTIRNILTRINTSYLHPLIFCHTFVR